MGLEKRIHKEWLDTALRARVDAEPRAGLEDRVLARLTSEPPRKALAWWPMAAAVTALILFAVAWMMMRPGELKQGFAVNTSSPRTGSRSDDGALHTPAVNAAKQATSKPHSKSTRRVLARESSNPKAERLPMLATFPAPRPEMQQERMLARLFAKRVSFVGDPVDLAQLRDLSVPEFKIQPMEEAPSDDTPQE
jgi:hypothetical protein